MKWTQDELRMNLFSCLTLLLFVCMLLLLALINLSLLKQLISFIQEPQLTAHEMFDVYAKPFSL